MFRTCFMALVTLAGLACDTRGDFFYVESEGAVMPVVVRGNEASGVYVVLLHGGPGDSAFFDASMSAFGKLEESWRMVYWDQRAAGSSLGNAPRETNRVDQFVTDLGIVIQVLRARYAVESIFLLGHSWGGRVGSQYVASDRRDPLVKGWIDVDGLDGYASTYGHSLEWVRATVPQWLAQPGLGKERREAAEEALAWHEAHPALGTGPFQEVFGRFRTHASHVYAMGGYSHDDARVAEEAGLSAGLLLLSPYDGFAQIGHAMKWLDYWDDRPEETAALLADVDLTAVTTPTLLIWGRHDGAIPVSVGESKLARLSALSEQDKTLLIFESSGHSPMAEEGERFASEVDAFIEARR